MPELPEVETVKRGLEPVVAGARIETVELRRGDIRFPFPLRFRERLAGRRVAKLGRRAKYLLFHLDSGETLIAHLGMSGSFRIERESVESTPGVYTRKRSKDPKHDHVVFRLDNGATITYNDPRRFGFMDLAKTGELGSHPRLIGLGDVGKDDVDHADEHAVLLRVAGILNDRCTRHCRGSTPACENRDARMTFVRFLAMLMRSRPERWENSTAKTVPSGPTMSAT